MKWFTRAANRGLAEVQYNLGLMYYNGYGVPQDYAQAREWIMEAANRDNAKAQYNLGLMFEHGLGVCQSRANAKRSFRRACGNGEQKGCDNYRRLDENR
ncbi:MAG: tetratricopeptide repeat protein [Moraxella sp.]|nr:tetratricopeptide repeat protein [Moraxella sp.]